MHSDRHPNFYSAHLQCVKRALISSLLSRVNELCHDDDTRKHEVRRLHPVLQDNGHQPELTEQALKDKSPTHKNDANCLASVSIPYGSGTSKVIRKIRGSYGVSVFCRIDNTLQHHITEIKDPRRQ